MKGWTKRPERVKPVESESSSGEENHGGKAATEWLLSSEHRFSKKFTEGKGQIYPCGWLDNNLALRKKNRGLTMHMTTHLLGGCVQKQVARVIIGNFCPICVAIILILRFCSAWYTVHNILHYGRISTFCQRMWVVLKHTKTQVGGKTQDTKKGNTYPDYNIFHCSWS